MDPVTVWAVELGRGLMRETKGSLSLEEDALVFTAADGFSHVRIALSEVRKARRVLGSPVLVVRHVVDEGTARTAFYFAQPPPLEPTGHTSRRKFRRQTVQYLGLSNAERRNEIKRWEHAVREALRAPGA